MSTYTQVWQAVDRVWKEAANWKSRDGETLAEWQARKQEMVAKRLHELLFPEHQSIEEDDIGML